MDIQIRKDFPMLFGGDMILSSKRATNVLQIPVNGVWNIQRFVPTTWLFKVTKNIYYAFRANYWLVLLQESCRHAGRFNSKVHSVKH